MTPKETIQGAKFVDFGSEWLQLFEFIVTGETMNLSIEFSKYKWRELHTLIFLNVEQLKLSISKFYQLCTCKSCDFTPNLEVIAQKTCLPRPWEVLSSQGHGRLIFQAKTSKFGENL